MPWLIATDEKLGERRYALSTPCLVGRGPYNHVVLDDSRISRQHAKISPEPEGHVVYDLNSANGTFVNDVRVRRQLLRPRDVLRFGPFTFRFEGDAPASLDSEREPPPRFLEVHTMPGLDHTPPPYDAALRVDPRDETGRSTEPQDLVELEDAGRKLRTLYQFLKQLSGTLDMGQLIERTLQHLLEVFPEAERAVFYPVNTDGSIDMRPRERIRPGRKPHLGLSFPPSFLEEVARERRSVLSAPLPSSWLRRAREQAGVAMHGPVVYGGVVHGVLHVRGGEKMAVPFTQDDLDLLGGLCAQAGMALGNVQLHLESLRRQRLEQDLQFAQQIQKSFLPQHLPLVPGLEFATEYRPAFSVGGDFYDVFWLGYNRLGVFIGDVSGKGVSAALLMARIASDLRLAAHAEGDPAKAMGHVNRIVVARPAQDIFVTGVYLTLDLAERRALIANAGHPPPVLRRADGRIERIEPSGIAIGMVDDAEYEAVEVALAPGDVVLLYTDGVVEATSPSGEQLGMDRVTASIEGGGGAVDLVKRLLVALERHVSGAPQYDDLTVVACGLSTTPSP